jgi:LacI family transcriptional regulator
MAKVKSTSQKKSGRVNIKEVAAHAGVAISSISRVLSGHPDTSAAMKKRVEDSVRALGYEADHVAQSLRKGATKTIGFMLRDITNPMFSVVAQSCESELRKAGYSMIYMNSDADMEIEKANFNLIKRRRVDGVIISLVSEEATHVKKMINEFGAPVVLLDRKVKGLKANRVICDHETGIFEATLDLIKKGHRRIAFITGKNVVYSTRARVVGFERAFVESGLSIPKDLMQLESFNESFAYEKIQEIFNGTMPATAIIAGGVGPATGALRAFKDLKIQPGVDFAFVVLDEWPMFNVISDSFSSVYRDPDLMGSESARLIVDLLKGKVRSDVVIPTVYRQRASSTENQIDLK